MITPTPFLFSLVPLSQPTTRNPGPSRLSWLSFHPLAASFSGSSPCPQAPRPLGLHTTSARTAPPLQPQGGCLLNSAPGSCPPPLLQLLIDIPVQHPQSPSPTFPSQHLTHLGRRSRRCPDSWLRLPEEGVSQAPNGTWVSRASSADSTSHPCELAAYAGCAESPGGRGEWDKVKLCPPDQQRGMGSGPAQAWRGFTIHCVCAPWTPAPSAWDTVLYNTNAILFLEAKPMRYFLGRIH